MQYFDSSQYLYSPSDLVNFLGCHHATFLDLQQFSKDRVTTEESQTAQLLQQKGLEHERFYLQQLKNQGYCVTEISKDGSLRERADATINAMGLGVDVIYQAVLYNLPWCGYADFLIKCNTPSSLGNYSYEVLDTKLARTAEPKHIIQLCTYSEFLTPLQGYNPYLMHLVLGDGEEYRFQVSEFFFYYDRAKERFEDYVKNPPENSYPEPCTHCSFCHWQTECAARWEKDDHLSRVANIQRSQLDKLRQAGITTIAELAAAPVDQKIPNLNPNVFQRLQAQAKLQAHKAKTGEDTYELLPAVSNCGIDRIPKPDEGDLFFDMEGDPLYPDGLEYLFGIYYLDQETERFKPFWAHDHEQEKFTFQAFMAFLADHLRRYPHAHIYHYNHYETTALKRLASRYGLCEEQLDNLLRQGKFVDLYVVVRESLRISEPSYSIKNLERFYREKRDEVVTTATDSIVVYHQWRETEDDQLLQEIADYNEVDCISTRQLRDWLLTLKFDQSQELEESSDQGDTSEPLERKTWEIEYEDYQTRLGIEQENAPIPHTRLSHLLEFHNREAKPQWWAMFDRQTQFEDELIEDAECLAGLEQVGEPYPEKRSFIYTYTFPTQETKLKSRDKPVEIYSFDDNITITELDETQRLIKLKRGKTQEPLPKRLALGPQKPISAGVLRSAIYRYADLVIASPDQSHPATELLAQNQPRIQGKSEGETIILGEDIKAEALDAVLNLDQSYLFIQGPPGSGKTYISSHIIVALIQQDFKVGVSSNSHKAIHNLLQRVEAVAKEQNVNFQGFKKSSSNQDSQFQGEYIQSVPKTEAMDLNAHLFAGTAWCFVNEHFQGQLDYLFIDEAGQVALANVVAMATATRNIILVGDQMQLGQPIQGIHPGEAGQSVLEFLLGEKATIPVEHGIFLPETRRLRPSLCQFISEAFYEGRLMAHESTLDRQLTLEDTDLPNEGIVMIPAEHEGCSQKSVVEGEIIQTRYYELLGQSFPEADGIVRAITKEDILVVTPYNVQVNYLQTLLPEGARVGTVDKFQGQEAAIALISMVTSNIETLPRNIEFLYSPNRLNVALSRAQCLAVVVMNPRLLEIPCTTIAQMQLVNTFCRLASVADSLG